MFGNNHFAKYAAGFLVGCVGMPVLKSGVAKKAYTYLTAGAFIARDSIMETVEKTQACALDIAEDAKEITEKYYAKNESAVVDFEDDEVVEEEA